MGSVHPITAAAGLERFLDFVYGEQTGFVYSPTKEPSSLAWEQYFFQWPAERQELINHIERFTPTHEVYCGPALYSSRAADKESFKSTRFVWAEFDGGLPADIGSLPQPTIKIQSSTEDHQHWYWKLDGDIPDAEVIESISQRLAYHLGADLGCWNINRVLRPVGSKHHESGNTVTVVRWSEIGCSIIDFISVPELPVKMLQEGDIKYIPPALDTIAKYPWEPANFDFFKVRVLPTAPGKPEGTGNRSSALAKLGHICMEMKMTDAEVLGILFNADDRWGKFAKRNDRKKQLLNIVNYCRLRHPVDEEGELVQEVPLEEDRLRIFSYSEFMNTDIKMEWLIEGLLHEKGLLCLSGPPGVGKSQITIRMAEQLAKGGGLLNRWNVVKPTRVLLVSMEMPHEELKSFMDTMRLHDPSGLLEENLQIMPVGSSIRLGDSNGQKALDRKIEKYEPEVIMFDSLGVALGSDISSDVMILNTFDYVAATLRQKYGAACWFIHHNRKPQVGNKKPANLEDMFGSQYIGGAISTGIGLWPLASGHLEVNCLKLRFQPKFAPFQIKRTPNLDFQMLEAPTNDTPLFAGMDDMPNSNSTLGDLI